MLHIHNIHIFPNIAFFLPSSKIKNQEKKLEKGKIKLKFYAAICIFKHMSVPIMLLG